MTCMSHPKDVYEILEEENEVGDLVGLRKWAIEQAIKAGYCTGEELPAAERMIEFVNGK